ncbi:MAG: 7TM-DISM domain-containing protein [Thiolinea sp.]
MLSIAMAPVAALDITDAMHQGKVVDLNDATLILQDPEHTFTPEMAIRHMSAPDFQSDSLTPSVNQYWFYTPLTSHTQYEQWTIRSFNVFFDELDFYWSCPGQTLQYTPKPPLGFHSPTLANAYYVPVTLPDNTSCGLLQQASGFVEGVNTQLLTSTVAIQQSRQTSVWNLLGLGAIVSLIIYNFLLYISLRNSTYFFYTVYACFHLALMILINFRSPELLDLFVGPRQALRILSASFIISAILFTLKFMQPGIESARKKTVKSILPKILAILIAACYDSSNSCCYFCFMHLFSPEQITHNVRFMTTYLFVSLLIPLMSLVVTFSGYNPLGCFFLLGPFYLPVILLARYILLESLRML